MDRRAFLSVFLYGVVITILSRLPWMRDRYGAVFRVVYVDPNGSGMDYAGHLGAYVYNAKRCCLNCQIIFAAWEPGGDVDNGPSFATRELRPINGAASRMFKDACAGLRTYRRSSFGLAS